MWSCCELADDGLATLVRQLCVWGASGAVRVREAMLLSRESIAIRRGLARALWIVFLASGSCLLLAAQSAPTRTAGAPSAAAIEAFQAATEGMRAGRIEEAIAGFAQVTREAPRFAEAYLNLGLALAQVSRSEEAAAALEKAISLKPGLRGAHLFLAISTYKLNRLDEAAAAIRKETLLDPQAGQAWMWQGIIDLAQGELAKAVEDLDHASSLDPKSVDILYHRGRAALALSRQSYEAMFALEPNSWHVHQVLAQADVESDHDGDAVEQYRLAIAAAPPQSGLYEAMGSSLWRMGKFQEAEAAYEEALKIDPNDTLAMYKLGCLRVDRGDAVGGKPLLDRVLANDPSLKLSAYYLGRAEFALGQDEKAVEDFKRVVEENLDADTTKQAYFQLSRVYRRLHEDAAAVAAQARYRELDQQTRDVLQQKLSRHQARADRDASIPSPALPASESEQ